MRLLGQFRHLRRTAGGERVLIHSATGGVGQAAIAIARAAGAEIFATAGSPDRRQLLANMGIEHVYDSRSTEFADEIRRNLAFYYADLALMTVADPERSGALLRKVYQMVGDGALPVQRCPAHRQAGADRAARRPGACSDAAGPGAGFPPDGSYIVTGGMGGLGLFLAAAMASAGCGRIVLTSRSGPNAQAKRTIARLKAYGADIVVECGNFAEPETAGRLVAAATATGLPLRDVLHAAAIVDDATLENITDELVERDWAPKAYGAWNLHYNTARTLAARLSETLQP